MASALKGFRVGDQVKAKIVKVDTEKGRVSFGMKASYFGEAVEEEEDEDMESEQEEDGEDIDDDEDEDDDEADSEDGDGGEGEEDVEVEGEKASDEDADLDEEAVEESESDDEDIAVSPGCHILADNLLIESVDPGRSTCQDRLCRYCLQG